MFAVWEPAMLADSMARVRGIMTQKANAAAAQNAREFDKNQTVVAVHIGDTCTC